MFIDIGIIAIILICFIVGLTRGTAKSIIKLISLAGALVLTWYLTPFIMDFVFDTDLLNSLVFGESLSLKSLYGGADIASQMESSFIIKTLCSPLKTQCEAIISANGITDVKWIDCLPYVLSVYTATLIVSLIVYMVVRLLIIIVMAIIKAIFLKYKPKALSRFIGGILGIVNSVVMIVWIMLIGCALAPIPALNQPIRSQADSSKAIEWTYNLTQETYDKFIVKDDYILKAIEQAIKNKK